jgi:hypothetical protein
MTKHPALTTEAQTSLLRFVDERLKLGRPGDIR